MNTSSFGNFIKSKREELKLSLRDAAKLIGISHSYLSTLEQGIDKRKNTPVKPTPEILKYISDAYNLDYTYLMNLVGYLSNLSSQNADELNIPKEYTNKYKVTSRDKKQYIEEMQKATEAFFMDDELNDEAKKEMLDLMSELFWESKAKNKRKK